MEDYIGEAKKRISLTYKFNLCISLLVIGLAVVGIIFNGCKDFLSLAYVLGLYTTMAFMGLGMLLNTFYKFYLIRRVTLEIITVCSSFISYNDKENGKLGIDIVHPVKEGNVLVENYENTEITSYKNENIVSSVSLVGSIEMPVIRFKDRYYALNDLNDSEFYLTVYDTFNDLEGKAGNPNVGLSGRRVRRVLSRFVKEKGYC